jgi:hypothetical protein
MKHTKSIYSALMWVNIYALAMGFLEAAVVIYLREMYYPTGFTFPLKGMPIALVKVEVLREAATIIMLVAIAMLASKTNGSVGATFYCPLRFGISSITLG